MKNYIMDYIYFFRDFSLHIILHSNPLPHGPVSLFIRARSVTVRSGEGSDEGNMRPEPITCGPCSFLSSLAVTM